MSKNEWTTEEVLQDITKQAESFKTNYEKLIKENNILNQRLSTAIYYLRKYASPMNWLFLNNHKSVYKGCGVKKATTALTIMNKLKKESIDE